MPSSFLLYGANGFVGREIARLAVKKGMRPIIAGRDRASIESLATELGLEHRVFDLDHVAIDGVTAVLHCAGPYLHTYKPMVSACLARGVHYLDITGEIPVYEGIAARGDEAKARGVMLMPGVRIRRCADRLSGGSSQSASAVRKNRFIDSPVLSV